MSIDFLQEAAIWLAEAEEDLDVAGNEADKHPAHACFHAQQAAEKALKAVYLVSGVDYPHVHSITELIDGLLDAHGELKKFRSAAAILNAFYIGTRYFQRETGVIPKKTYTTENAVDAIGKAQAISEECRRVFAAAVTANPPQGGAPASASFLKTDRTTT